MSTITVVRKNGYAAIAADTLTKWGSAKESAHHVVAHDKVLRVQDSFLAIAGLASAQLALEHFFAQRNGDTLHSASAIYATWLELHHALKEDYFLKPMDDEEDAYESSGMDVAIANAHGIFTVVGDRAVQEYTRFSACGCGREYAMGAMFAAYDRDNLSAEDIARIGVEAGAEFDDSTGLPVLSYTIRLK